MQIASLKCARNDMVQESAEKVVDLQQNVAEDSADVEAYYDQKSPPQPMLEATILVAQTDGKSVPTIIE